MKCSFLPQKIHHTCKIAVSSNQNCFCKLPFIKIAHCSQYHFRIAIPLWMPSVGGNFLERQIVANGGQSIVEWLVSGYIAKEDNDTFYMVFGDQPVIKLFVVQIPTQTLNALMQICAVNVRNEAFRIRNRHSDDRTSDTYDCEKDLEPVLRIVTRIFHTTITLSRHLNKMQCPVSIAKYKRENPSKLMLCILFFELTEHSSPERHRERRPLPDFTLDMDLPTVKFDDPLHKGKTQSIPAVSP